MSFRKQSLGALVGCAMLVSFASCRPAPSEEAALRVTAPLRVTQALTSSNGNLCDDLRVALTFDRTDDLGPAPIDGVVLEPSAPCTWVLKEPVDLLAGSYDLLARFDSRTRPGTCAGPVIVGVYVRRALPFPFALDFTGLTEADFLSTSEDAEDPRLEGTQITFNSDGDERDNLSEMSAGADPCHANSVPVVEISDAPSATVDEGTVFGFRVTSIDADDVPHRIVVSLRHPNGEQYPPSEVTWSSWTNSSSSIITPDVGTLGWRHQWFLSATSDEDPRSGAGTWSFQFTGEEPFVGDIILSVRADDGVASLLASARSSTVSVSENGEADPPIVLVEAEGRDIPITTLRFEEQRVPPDTRLFRIGDRNLGSPSSSFTPVLDTQRPAPEGVQLTQSGPSMLLSWSPTNGQAATGGPFVATVDLYDGQQVLQGQALVELEISPFKNDPPVIEAPRPQHLALPPSFTRLVIPFSIHDPDRTPSAPTCHVDMPVPSGTTSCTGPAPIEASCAVTGPRAEGQDAWPFAITLVAGSDYATCTAKPTFRMTVSTLDSPPSPSVNGPLTAELEVELRTRDAVVVSVVENGPAAGPEGVPYPNIAYIDGPMKRALALHDYAATLIDLANPSQGYLKVFNAETEACRDGGASPRREIGAVDEINHRVMIIDWIRPEASTCESGMALFDLATQTVVTRTLGDACGAPVGGLGDTTNPVVDPTTGDFYFLCETGSREYRLVRYGPQGQRTTKPATGFSSPLSQGHLGRVVVTKSGARWWVIQSSTGFYLVNLATFDAATVETLSLTAAGSLDIDERVIDTERDALLYLFESEGSGYLGRIDFQAGAPVALAPILLGESDHFALRSMGLRRPYTAGPTPAPQLVVSLGHYDVFHPVVRLDLETFSPVGAPKTTADFDFGGRSERFDSTPDRRYFLQNVYVYAPTGFLLHRFDGGPSIFVPHGGLDDRAYTTTTSNSGHLIVVAASKLLVLKFPEAEEGLDE